MRVIAVNAGATMKGVIVDAGTTGRGIAIDAGASIGGSLLMPAPQ